MESAITIGANSTESYSTSETRHPRERPPVKPEQSVKDRKECTGTELSNKDIDHTPLAGRPGSRCALSQAQTVQVHLE